MVKVKTNPFSAFQPEIPTTTVSKKAPTSVHIVGPLDSHPPPGPLPTKKCVPVPPYCHFLKGLVGQAFFSSSPLCSCDDILHGHSVIIHSFHKPQGMNQIKVPSMCFVILLASSGSLQNLSISGGKALRQVSFLSLTWRRSALP